MYATASHAHQPHQHSTPPPHSNRASAYPTPAPSHALPNGHALPHHLLHQQQQQHHPQPNGYPHQPQPPAPSHRPPPPQQATPRHPITVQGVPSVTIQDGQQVVGDARSSSARSYTMLKVVGDGSFGTVWLCDWHGDLPPNTPLSAMQCNAGSRPEYAGKKLVAVKRMKKQWQGGWEECKRLKELESLRTIPYHPNIIPLYDFFLLPDTKELYFVFESMEGNLYQLIKSRKGRPLAGGLVSSVFRQVVSGLHHIHVSGYFHRDMKPENLLVTTTGLYDYQTLNPMALPGALPERDVVVIVKLADFGLARETKSKPPYTEYVATRWYRAPEVLLRSRDYSNPVDMWALGTIMAELVTLRPLFPGSDEIDQVSKICNVLGDPSDEYGHDPRGKVFGGGKWKKGIKMAQGVGLVFPKTRPQNLFQHFDRSIPTKLVECIVDLLRYDPDARLTSLQCLEHPYLAETTPRNDPPFPPLRYSASDPSVQRRIAAPANGLVGPGSTPTVDLRPIPPSHTHTSVSQPNQPRPPFNTHGVLAIPEASASHRSAFSSSTSTVGQSDLSRDHTQNGPAAPSSVYLDGADRVADVSNGSWPNVGDVIAPQPRHLVPPPLQTQPPEGSQSPMVQDDESARSPLPSIHVNGSDPRNPPAPSKPRFGVNTRKFRLMFGGDKNQGEILPPVDELNVALATTRHALKRQKSSSLDGHMDDGLPAMSPADQKKMKKEAAKMAREAEKQRRAMAEKNYKEQARAVNKNRDEILSMGQASNPWSMIGNAGDARAKQAATSPMSPEHQSFAGSLSPEPPSPLEAAAGMSSDMHWREADQEREIRMVKARRRDWDDDHSMSSSEAPSLGRLSAMSFATVDSDPGPHRLRHRPSYLGLGHMTSTSSLRTSLSIDDFAPSIRSSNSLSLEQQLADAEFRRSHAAASSTSSPPPLTSLILSPTQHAWSDHGASKEDGSSPGSPPQFIALPPARIPKHSHYLVHPTPHSPQEIDSDPMNHTMQYSSSRDPHKADINPIFKVPPLPASSTESPISPNALPPFSQIEAVADGEYPPLSPMSFQEPEDQ